MHGQQFLDMYMADTSLGSEMCLSIWGLHGMLAYKSMDWHLEI